MFRSRVKTDWASIQNELEDEHGTKTNPRIEINVDIKLKLKSNVCHTGVAEAADQPGAWAQGGGGGASLLHHLRPHRLGPGTQTSQLCGQAQLYD